ncbi:hypothetical protein ASG77_03865 [Arthrobacter sp. Soil762]|nr:hypothetical protein ASG77_03865 [Arthrobacter sp. Soil762]
MDSPEVQQALDALQHRLDGGRRPLLGITGAPGSGKSTFAARLQQEFGPDLAGVEPFSVLKVLFIAGMVGCAARLKSLPAGKSANATPRSSP